MLPRPDKSPTAQTQLFSRLASLLNFQLFRQLSDQLNDQLNGQLNKKRRSDRPAGESDESNRRQVTLDKADDVLLKEIGSAPAGFELPQKPKF